MPRQGHCTFAMAIALMHLYAAGKPATFPRATLLTSCG